MVVILLPRAEDVVARRDLVGMQHPFAVIAQRRRPTGDPPETVDVTDLQIRPVDREDAVRAGGDQDPHQHMVMRVADVVTLRLLADLEGAHVEARRHVRGSQDQRLHPRARRDRVNVGQPLRVFDLRLNPDAAHR